MGLQAWYAALGLLGFVAEMGLLVILLTRRQYRTFPVFTLYIAFNVLTDVGLAAIMAVYLSLIHI